MRVLQSLVVNELFIKVSELRLLKKSAKPYLSLISALFVLPFPYKVYWGENSCRHQYPHFKAFRSLSLTEDL